MIRIPQKFGVPIRTACDLLTDTEQKLHRSSTTDTPIAGSPPRIAMTHHHLLFPAILLACLGMLAGADTMPIKILILDGFSNHNWQETTRCIRGILEPTGFCQVSVATCPADQQDPAWPGWNPPFTGQDVVIQTCNDIQGHSAWPEPVHAALATFVRNGGGMYVWHAGNNAFAGHVEYDRMIGLGWRDKTYGVALRLDAQGTIERIPAGTGNGTGHGKRFDALIHVRGDHPIYAGLPRAWRAADTEVYAYARGPADHLEVLSYALDEARTQMYWPMEWTVNYGKGRVYTSVFGHVWKNEIEPVTVRDVGVRTLVVRAVQWLAGRPVTWPMPADFPTTEKVSIHSATMPGATPAPR
jgi:type 1 glutamine amidotransferase